MAATSSEIKAELLLRFPGCEPIPVGTFAFPMTMVPAGEGFMNVSVDLSGLDKMKTLNEEP